MTWRVFYSYSHRDAALRERLGVYLAPLRKNQKIVDWHDRNIEPGANWAEAIESKLESADLVLLLVSADFLDSAYCDGVEVEQAMARMNRGEATVVPILMGPCLWEESRFSQLQMIPRDGKPITSSASPDEALTNVAAEISKLVSGPPPTPAKPSIEPSDGQPFAASLELVRTQLRAYTRLYERTRQRMPASNERTQRMEDILLKMRGLATASYPLLDELAASVSPGDRLAAVAILQVFATDRYFDFLARLVETEKPFVGYHAALALRFAASAIDPIACAPLHAAIRRAQAALDAGNIRADADRQAVLRAADAELAQTLKDLSAPTQGRG